MNIKNVVALNNLARANIKLQNYDEAKSVLKKAKILSPKYIETYLNLAHIAKLESQMSDIGNFARKKYFK